MSGYAVARLDEIEELNDGREPFRPVRHHLGITAFGVNAWTAKNAGDRILNEHDEADDGQEELYLVTEGHAVFELDGERTDAPAGTFVFVRPGVKRTAFAEQPATTIVVIGGNPGKPYEVAGWELWAPLRPAYEAGRIDEVRDKLRPLAEQNPQYPMLGYNLACLESLSGQKDEAIAHLRTAIGQSEYLRGLAKTDTDLDPIREEPAVQELLAG
jgi:hypothetical protein